MRSVLRFGAPGVAALVIGAFPAVAAAEPACTAPKSHCAGTGGYYASSEDVDRLTAVADPVLRDLRSCLDSAGAKHVTPALVMRWDSEGKAVEVKIDVPGYESLPCVAKASGKLAALQNPHETAIRCEFGCAKPAPPPPPPPVPVVAPPAPTTTTPPVAAPPPSPPVKPVQYEKNWYGWQTLVADGASVALFAGGLATNSGGLAGAGYVAFLLATPIVHMVHGNIGPGFGSLGIRLFLPPIALGVGAIAGLIVGGSSGSGDFDRLGNGANGAVVGAVIGGFVGVAGCALIDTAAFAWTKEKVEASGGAPITRADRSNVALGRPKVPVFTLAPVLDLTKDRTGIGVAGRF